jgi:hypothetical protein
MAKDTPTPTNPTDMQKCMEYYRTAAQQRAYPMPRPRWIPSRVRIPKHVCGDGPFCTTMQKPGDYPCHCNPLGAVSVTATNGEMLGLRLNEFEPLEWRENPEWKEPAANG